MAVKSKVFRFEEMALSHLGAAYNLARWLVHNDHDAEDMVQEAYLRAFKFFGGSIPSLATIPSTTGDPKKLRRYDLQRLEIR